MVLTVAHWGLAWLLDHTLPKDWTMRRFLDATMFITFSLIYVTLLWDLLTIFIPVLGGRRESSESGVVKRSD